MTDLLLSFVRLQLLVFLFGCLALVGYRLITHPDTTKGLLCQEREQVHFSPHRLQLLLLTLVGAFSYLGLVMANLGEVSGPIHALPDVPNELLMLVGGGNAVYIGGKGWVTWRGKRESSEGKQKEGDTP